MFAKAVLPRSAVERLKMLKRQTHPESWPPVEFDNSYPG
jgi:hypothetical protein